MGHVDSNHSKQKIEFTGEPMKLDHFGHLANLVDERGDDFGCVVAGLHEHLHSDSEPKFVTCEQRDPLSDDSLSCELLDSFPARRRGKSYRPADLGNGRAGVPLQDLQYLPVRYVHSTPSLVAAFGF